MEDYDKPIEDSLTIDIEQESTDSEEETVLISQLENPLEKKDDIFQLIFKDARICHFVADLIAGKPADDAAKSNFATSVVTPQIDEATAKEVCDAMQWVPEMWDSMSKDINEAYSHIMNGDCSQNTIMLLCKGNNYENAILDAEQKGYVRGKNEKIELIKQEGTRIFHSNSFKDNSSQRYTSILENSRRSVWDD